MPMLMPILMPQTFATPVNMSSVCKKMADGKCAVSSVLSAWNYDPATIKTQTQAEILATVPPTTRAVVML